MKLGLLTGRTCICTLCGWEDTSVKFHELKETLVDHLMREHGRSPLMMDWVERKWANKRDWVIEGVRWKNDMGVNRR